MEIEENMDNVPLGPLGEVVEGISNASTEQSVVGHSQPLHQRSVQAPQSEPSQEQTVTKDGSTRFVTPAGSSIRPIVGASSYRSSGGRPRSRIGAVYHQSGPIIRMSDSAHPPMIHKKEEEVNDATWGEVCTACCCHSTSEWTSISILLLTLLGLLYFFLVGLDLLGTAFKVVSGCKAGSLLGSDTNPLASVLIGIIATALLQSSSTTTAVIVSLVSGGLDVKQGIYMVMGANVGTAVTPMLVSLAHMGDGDEMERAFAGSSVLYIFNLLTAILLLPIEIATEYLYVITKAMLPSMVSEGESWDGPIRKIVSPFVRKIIIANKDLIEDITSGNASCSQLYPISCVGGEESYLSCKNRTGVIDCDEDTGDCPAFFQNGASQRDDMVSGWVCMIIALTILVVCLIGLVALLRKMLLGASTRIIYKATNINPYLAILIGCGVTVLVQSSSITTSTLVPLAGVGVLTLENMYPLVLGADVGTTFTALMAAMVSSKIQSLQIALVHLFFNLTGIAIWYPIPFMRRIVLRISALLGKATRHWRSFPAVFILIMFFLLPLILLGISSCFESQTAGFTALGVFFIMLIIGAIAFLWFWWSCRNGKAKFSACINRRQRRAAAIEQLADDMDYLKVDTEWCKNEIGRLKDFAGLLTAAQEEGRVVTAAERPEDEMIYLDTEEDDRITTFESCRSRPWKDILYMASGSIRTELRGSSTK